MPIIGDACNSSSSNPRRSKQHHRRPKNNLIYKTHHFADSPNRPNTSVLSKSNGNLDITTRNTWSESMPIELASALKYKEIPIASAKPKTLSTNATFGSNKRSYGTKAHYLARSRENKTQTKPGSAANIPKSAVGLEALKSEWEHHCSSKHYNLSDINNKVYDKSWNKNLRSKCERVPSLAYELLNLPESKKNSKKCVDAGSHCDNLPKRGSENKTPSGDGFEVERGDLDALAKEKSEQVITRTQSTFDAINKALKSLFSSKETDDTSRATINLSLSKPSKSLNYCIKSSRSANHVLRHRRTNINTKEIGKKQVCRDKSLLYGVRKKRSGSKIQSIGSKNKLSNSVDTSELVQCVEIFRRRTVTKNRTGHFDRQRKTKKHSGKENIAPKVSIDLLLDTLKKTSKEKITTKPSSDILKVTEVLKGPNNENTRNNKKVQQIIENICKTNGEQHIDQSTFETLVNNGYIIKLNKENPTPTEVKSLFESTFSKITNYCSNFLNRSRNKQQDSPKFKKSQSYPGFKKQPGYPTCPVGWKRRSPEALHRHRRLIPPRTQSTLIFDRKRDKRQLLGLKVHPKASEKSLSKRYSSGPRIVISEKRFSNSKSIPAVITEKPLNHFPKAECKSDTGFECDHLKTLLKPLRFRDQLSETKFVCALKARALDVLERRKISNRVPHKSRKEAVGIMSGKSRKVNVCNVCKYRVVCDCDEQDKGGFKCSDLVLPVSEATFLGPTVDDTILHLINCLPSSCAEKIGLLQHPKTGSKADSTKKTTCLTKDAVQWLHDEYMCLSQEVANNQTMNGGVGGGKRTSRETNAMLESRRFVLDRLAELLETKQELEVACSGDSKLNSVQSQFSSLIRLCLSTSNLEKGDWNQTKVIEAQMCDCEFKPLCGHKQEYNYNTYKQFRPVSPKSNLKESYQHGAGHNSVCNSAQSVSLACEGSIRRSESRDVRCIPYSGSQVQVAEDPVNKGPVYPARINVNCPMHGISSNMNLGSERRLGWAEDCHLVSLQPLNNQHHQYSQHSGLLVGGASASHYNSIAPDQLDMPKGCTKVQWAITRITSFPDNSRTYEVMKPTERRPFKIPNSSDCVFVVVPREERK